MGEKGGLRGPVLGESSYQKSPVHTGPAKSQDEEATLVSPSSALGRTTSGTGMDSHDGARGFLLAQVPAPSLRLPIYPHLASSSSRDL